MSFVLFFTDLALKSPKLRSWRFSPLNLIGSVSICIKFVRFTPLVLTGVSSLGKYADWMGFQWPLPLQPRWVGTLHTPALLKCIKSLNVSFLQFAPMLKSSCRLYCRHTMAEQYITLIHSEINKQTALNSQGLLWSLKLCNPNIIESQYISNCDIFRMVSTSNISKATDKSTNLRQS